MGEAAMITLYGAAVRPTFRAMNLRVEAHESLEELAAERSGRAATQVADPGSLNHLKRLEHEAIAVFREVAGAFENPCILFSGGKDSLVLLRLAEKAFHPGTIPFPLLHVDTGHNFSETIEFRDRRAAELGARLIVASVEETLRKTRSEAELHAEESRNRLQSATLLEALREHRFDAALGGARRDEEKARAKERVFSHRDEFGQWDPKNQRPELWRLYAGRLNPREHMRVFPLSDWTELDIWQYIAQENLALPSLYFAHEREVFARDGLLFAPAEYFRPRAGEPVFRTRVRYRTIGDVTCTGAVRSQATTVPEIIREILISRSTERGQTRADDRQSEASMEERKREGYF
jgi:sulfate adenylyltransferase subunit 2